MKTKYYIIIMIVVIVGCKNDDFDREFNSTYPVAGEWYVSEYYDGGFVYGPYHLQIFNTSFSKDSIWISNIYDSGIKLRAKVNADKTFGVTKSADIEEHVSAGTISGGKIIDTDSIYFEVILLDEDDEVIDEFFTAGRRWTGLEEE